MDGTRVDLSSGLSGEVAVVTGGSRGIGFALARALARSGAALVVINRSRSACEEAAERIRSEGATALAVPADITQRDLVDGAFDLVVERFGALHILVNCAGTNVRTPAMDVTDREWDTIVDTNLRGLFLCCRAAARHMSVGGGGKIINMSSLAAGFGFVNRSVYSATKAAVSQLTRALALEWASVGVTVNAIAPGILRTPLTEAYVEAEPARLERVLAKTPLGRLGTPEDLVGVALLLASRASDYITGQTIVVDGGYSLGCMDW
jgi:NAD(P)-dependent dehydrogenase (short-subunit alcohol dehydrogenase family)